MSQFSVLSQRATRSHTVRCADWAWAVPVNAVVATAATPTDVASTVVERRTPLVERTGAALCRGT